MRIHLYKNDGTKLVSEIQANPEDMPTVAYTFEGEYRYFVRGSARNSATYYEVEALHVTETTEETLPGPRTTVVSE